MTAFNQKHFFNIIWYPWEEFYHNSKLFSCNNFPCHCAALDNSWSRYSRKIHVKLKWNFTNVFNVKIFWWRLIVRDLTIIELSCWKLEFNETWFTNYWNFIVRASINAAYCNTVIKKSMSRLKCELNIFSLSWF